MTSTDPEAFGAFYARHLPGVGSSPVWLEFKLDADHGERFDPTPSRLDPNGGRLSTGL